MTAVRRNTEPAENLKTMEAVFSFYKFSLSKSGALTASENNLFLHSAYNPLREAATAADALKDCGKDIFIFAGIGLGYLPQACAGKFPDKTFILLEPDPPHFFAALASLDFSELFKIRKLFFIIGADTVQAAGLVESAGGFENAKIFWQKPQVLHAQKWFEEFLRTAEQSRQKAEVNINTLEKFGFLWLKNASRNLEQLQKCDGVNIYFNGLAETGNDIPALLLAAGPGLEKVLPCIRKMQERAVTICVDTALRAALAAGIEPDFIVLTDPQFWAASHITGISAPSSVLVTESAVYPSVFRFVCRKKVLVSSLFPLGKFMESCLGQKGALASGGSVSTTAWDLARLIGCRKIFTAGLDLCYPGRQTHIKGSTFEQSAHTTSFRTKTAETLVSAILFSARNSRGIDYDGSTVITDERMKLFAWWFENKIASTPGVKTYTFSSTGLAVRGIECCSAEELLRLPAIVQQKKEFFERAEKRHSSYDKKEFDLAVQNLNEQFCRLKVLAESAIAKCNDILVGLPGAGDRLVELSAIDKKIMASDAKAVVSLVFPSQRQLDRIIAGTKMPEDPVMANAMTARIIYKEILKAADLWQYKEHQE